MAEAPKVEPSRDLPEDREERLGFRPEIRADLECRVTIRLSPSPAYYHLLEIRSRGQSVCVQISSDCPRETVTQFAAFVAGLGVV